MKMKNLLIAVAALFLVAGCASSTKVAQPLVQTQAVHRTYAGIDVVNRGTAAPEHFIAAVSAYLKEELRQTGSYSETQGDLIEITLTDYRMRSGFNRAMFGVLAGKDGVDSTVVVKNPNTGHVVGRSTVSSYNALAVGGMEDIARMHAEEIAKYLNGGT